MRVNLHEARPKKPKKLKGMAPNPYSARSFILGLARDRSAQAVARIRTAAPELAGLLDADPELEKAIANGTDYDLELDASTYEWWPLMDEDADGEYRWYSVCYYPVYRVRKGELTVGVNVCDTDGNHDGNDEASPLDDPEEYKRMRSEYSYNAWCWAMAEYSEDVALTGLDPLDYYMPPRPPVHTIRWQVGVKEVDGRPKFWKARAISNDPPSPPPTENPADLPNHARDYLMLDAEGFLGISMEEFVAADGVTNHGDYWQIDFTTDEQVNDDLNRAAWLRAKGAEDAQRYARDAEGPFQPMI